MKKFASIILALVLCAAFAVPTMAAADFSDDVSVSAFADSELKIDEAAMNDGKFDIGAEPDTVDGFFALSGRSRIKYARGDDCSHQWGSDGYCTECGAKCPHGSTITFCCDCGLEFRNDLTASTLSEGSLVILVGIVCLAVGFLAATFIFKKKKPATAGGENKDEE